MRLMAPTRLLLILALSLVPLLFIALLMGPVVISPLAFLDVMAAAVGLPVEAIAVLFVFDRILDMARTIVNVLGDASCAVIVARLEGEETRLAKPE